MDVRPRPATRGDLPEIDRLLRENDLPPDGTAQHLEWFTVVEDAGRIVASAGMERYGQAGLLRSLAVRSEYRGRGLGRTLVNHVLERAARERISEVFLLTTTAADYFRRLGFVPIERNEVPALVQASKEFDSGCCTGAQAMRWVGSGRGGPWSR